MPDDAKSFWTSLPGILTGLAAVVTSVTGLFLATNGGMPKPAHEDGAVAVVAPAPVQKPVPASPTAQSSGGAAVDAGIYVLPAVIEDPDGFINVRAGRSTKADIVAVVKNDEQFRTYKQDTKWWQVKTRDGVVGYVHVSRIRLLDAPPGN